MHATANEKVWVLVSEWVSEPAPYCPKMLGRMSTGKACCIGEWSRSTIRRLHQILFRKWSCSFAEKFINQRRLNYVLYQFFCLTVRGWNFSRTSRTCTADKAWGLRWWWWSSEFWAFGKNYNSLQFCNLPNLKSNVVNTNVVWESFYYSRTNVLFEILSRRKSSV